MVGMKYPAEARDIFAYDIFISALNQPRPAILFLATLFVKDTVSRMHISPRW